MSDIYDGLYVGVRPYERADSGSFFGRTAEATLLSDLWRRNRLVYIVGHAGVGKTSLLNAGALPLLGESRLDILPVGRLSYGAAFPVAALPVRNLYTFALLRSWSPGETATRLTDETVSDFMLRRPGDGPILAAIDPADEIMADSGPRRFQRKSFLLELAEALSTSPRLHLLIVGREEVVSEASSTLGSGVRYEVAGLTWQSAADAVSGPLAKVRAFTDDAVETFVNDLRDSRVVNPDRTVRYLSLIHI